MPEHCDQNPSVVREHERRLTSVEEVADSAHKRMDNLEDFKETMYQMNANVLVIAEQLKTMATTLIRHEDSIRDIDSRLASEENKEAQEALKQMNSLKKWIIGSLGAMILAIVMMYLGLK